LIASIENPIVKLINDRTDNILSNATANSPRAAGDAIQELIGQNLSYILGDFVADYSDDFARRAMADLAFTVKEDNSYYIVDVKTHRLDTKFNMPNLTSVERLSRFYEDDKNYFCLLMVHYNVEGKHIEAKSCHFAPIEQLSWDCLTIGALGWGQIQIANANKVYIDRSAQRAKWMIELCDVLLSFYPKEILKIEERIQYFERVKARWAMKLGSI